jgi:hypothetical protein
MAHDIVAVKREHDAMKGLPAPSDALVCTSCGQRIRVTERLMRLVKHPECVACGGDMEPVA